MKIAFLLNSVSRKAGGLFEICRRLAQTSCREEEIAVLGVEDEFTKADIPGWAPLRPAVFSPGFARSFGYAPGYAQYLAEICPDIAHVHGLWTYSSLAGYQWHRRTKGPVMYTAHGMLDPWALRNSAWKKHLARALWENAAHRSAACFHVNSEAEYTSAVRFGLRNAICVIPNGIDLPDLEQQIADNKPPATDTRHLTSDRRVLLYLGRLHPKKNLANLIRAWKVILSSHSSGPNSWRLAIAGWDQGGYGARLRQLTIDLGLATNVTFLGQQFGEHKDACYRACDAFVLPSLSEGLPMAALEAWAYAKPVLMTPECNLPEGFAADAALGIGASPNETAAGLRQLLEMTDGERKQMGIRGRTLVAEKFSWPRIGQQMRAVYKWVLGGGTPPETVRLRSGARS